MRSITISALTLAALLFNAAPGSAYVLSERVIDGAPVPIRWPQASLPLRFLISDRPVAQLLNLVPGANPQAAVEGAVRSWSSLGVPVQIDGMTTKADAIPDGVNVITFADTPANRQGPTTNFLARTQTWVDTLSGDIRETDILVNFRVRFATDGRKGIYDVEAALVHEIGHALGLAHSPLLSATMFWAGAPGDTSPRRLIWDDIAGARAIYMPNDPSSTSFGAIRGRILNTRNEPIYGAHVVAVDANGISQVGALTDALGQFTLTSLPPGTYQVFAEPLDGPTPPPAVGNSTLVDPAKPVQTQFRTAFAAANGAPASITVRAGETVRLDPLKVVPQAHTINPLQIAWEDATSSFYVYPSAELRAGQAVVMLAVGPGVDTVPNPGYRASGVDIEIDTNLIVRDKLQDGTPFVAYALGVRPGARPGPRNLYFVKGDEIAAYPGGIRVVAP